MIGNAIHFFHIFPNFGPGGMELRATRIINGIGPRVRHTILALWGNYDARDFIYPSICVEFLTPPARAGMIASARSLRAIQRMVQPDLLLTYNWGSIYSVLSAWTIASLPLVHHECGFTAEESGELKRRRVLARRLLLRRASAVAVTSRTLREIAIHQFKVPSAKVQWIRTGVDVDRFRPGLSREWRRRVGVREDELLFGFVGVLRAEKNLRFLLRAFAAAGLRNAKLAIIGDGGERLLLEAAAREEGISERVVFNGRISDPTVCFASLDAFLLCSTTEQTSNALLEAMSCGLPAVSTDVGDCRELLGDAGFPAVIPPGDLDRYSAAIRTLAGSEECRERLGTANRRRCLDKYRLDRMVQEYEALYETTIRTIRPGVSGRCANSANPQIP